MRGLAIIVLALLLTSGCGSPIVPPTATTSPALPSMQQRPREIHVDNLDPCSVLSPAQLAILDVARPQLTPAEGSRGSICQWSHFPTEPLDSYLVELDPRSGIEESFDNPRGVHPTTIAGFPTIETQGFQAPKDTNCGLVIDIARGQTLNVLYDYNGSQVPMTRELACTKARAAAELAMQTLLQR